MRANIQRLAVVSNRLPVNLTRTEGGQWRVERGSGGLVTALSPVLRDRGGLWIGWAGADEVDALDGILDSGGKKSGYRLVPVALNRQEIDDYYNGFCNEVLWMLFHDLISLCNFEPKYWESYQQANLKFAEIAAAETRTSDFLWVQDYHLLLVAQMLEKLGVKRKTGIFLHTPFPPVDGFLKLPWRGEILQGMLAYDLIGFQTMRDMRNFLQCVHMLVPGVRLNDVRGLRDLLSLIYRVRALVPGVRSNKVRSTTILRVGEREVRIGAFPISIDFEDFARRARMPETSEIVTKMKELLPKSKLILGIDRLDYSKGIPLRLRALSTLLESNPDLRGKISLVQVVVPSRLDSERHQTLKKEVDRLVGEINGRFSETGWTPILYIFRSLTEQELLAYYRRCDIALVTPLKDGMNLVAKEYCACCVDNDGVLILSEFAGAASQINKDALLVNPFDINGVANAILRAYTMPMEERKQRMKRIRLSIRDNTVFQWVDDYLSAAIAKSSRDFPLVEDYVPDMFTQYSQEQSQD